MPEVSLIDYLKENKVFDVDLFDSLYFDIGCLVYYYGDHFINPREKTIHFKKSIKSSLKEQFIKYNIRLNILRNRKYIKQEPKIISNSYFTVNSEIKALGYNVYRPIWAPVYRQKLCANISLLNKTNFIKDFVLNKNFSDIISPKFLKTLKSYQKEMTDFYNKQNILALFVPNDISFMENFTIKIFKEIDKPSFIFLHGLPCRFNHIDENRSDYLIVWGEEIKNLYVKAGFSKDKIFVSGHPYYKDFDVKSVRFSFDNILIITKSLPGSQTSDKIRLYDRGNLIVYLLQIQKVLKTLGIKSVRLRPHPSENISWYYKFIDKDFFRADTDLLSDSLNKATLVIGPSSTVFLESIYYGVNYVIFEPCIDEIDYTNFEVVPPFDGSYDEIPVAKSEEELKNILEDKIKLKPTIFNRFVKSPFDLSFIKELIEN
ncbi:MAG: hypothetical protein ACFE8G_04385 [Candidatus Hermodarchaeota archaeon]